MIKTTAPSVTPSPETSEKAPNSEGGNNQALTMFVGAVLDLSWRMAFVVLVPVIGGFELDKHLGTSPSFIILGFLLAMAGTFFVLRGMLVTYGNRTVSNTKEGKKQ